MARIDFDDSDYRFTHGRRPRGVGYWAFATRTRYDATNPEQVWWAPPSTSFADAKKWAKAEAVRRFGAEAEGVLIVCT